jgi:catechol 2,3-dioxygenase
MNAPQKKQFALTRPAFVEQVHLVVNDLAQVSEFYQRVIGLSVLEKSASGDVLGVAGKPLLTLTTRQDAVRSPRSAAGLFHTAFLVPTRQDLAHWLAHAAANDVRLEGASDHLVSEALYLSDPEGNGIEIYRDRQPDEWSFHDDGTVEMATARLDLQELHASAPQAVWSGMAEGTSVGHIHLQVGDVPQAEAFYRDVLGLKVMARYPGASFFATGGYHHHVAANIWNSRGAGPRQENMTGLADYTLRFNDPETLASALKSLQKQQIDTVRTSDGWSLKDPWGIGIKLSS